MADTPAIKPVNRCRLSKVELKKRLAERSRKYYDAHFVELRERALANYHPKRALLKEALAAEEAARAIIAAEVTEAAELKV